MDSTNSKSNPKAQPGLTKLQRQVVEFLKGKKNAIVIRDEGVPLTNAFGEFSQTLNLVDDLRKGEGVVTWSLRNLFKPYYSEVQEKAIEALQDKQWFLLLTGDDKSIEMKEYGVFGGKVMQMLELLE